MKRALLIFSLALAGLLAGALAFNPSGASGAYSHGGLNAPAADRPVYGWTICADLGGGLIPGVGIRQRFRICHAEGWVLQAYCLNTDLPAPAVGTLCEFVNATDLWCGESVQLLRVYAQLQTPAPTATATRTATSTATPTSTVTRTPTQTVTLTATSTTLPTRNLIAASTSTPVVPTTVSRATQVLPTRTRPGGPGKLETILLPAGLGGLALLAAGALTWRFVRRRKAADGNEKRS